MSWHSPSMAHPSSALPDWQSAVLSRWLVIPYMALGFYKDTAQKKQQQKNKKKPSLSFKYNVEEKKN